MRIAVTGTTGQVARSLIERAAQHPGVEIIPVGRPALDLLRPATVAPALAAARPDLIVSAAAYTAVDKAEDDVNAAFGINRDGAGAVAVAAAQIAVPVIHISTDYVFAGTGIAAHREDDPVGPLQVYGGSKYEGEKAVAAANPRHLILRTAWVYSPFGRNFVRTMLDLATKRDEIAVVADQWGNPSSALDLAEGILRAAAAIQDRKVEWGVYHLAGTGEINWSGLARRIFEVSRASGGPFADVRDITTAEYPTRARRPLNSRLDSGKFARTFGWTMPDWRDSVAAVVARCLDQP